MRRQLLLANVRGILKTQRGECGSIAPIIGLLTELKKDFTSVKRYIRE